MIYLQLDDAKPVQRFSDAVTRVAQQATFDEIVVTEPSEYRVWTKLGIGLIC